MIKIHVHSNDGEEPSIVTINEEATVEELLRQISPEGHAHLFLVVDEERGERHHKLHECGVRDDHHVHCHPHEIHYTVDKEPQKTTHQKLTAFEIIKSAGVDPATHYLIRLKGDRDKVSYQNEPKAVIHLHNCMRFLTASLGPTPVS